MNENIRAVLSADETVALHVVEPLHRSLHLDRPPCPEISNRAHDARPPLQRLPRHKLPRSVAERESESNGREIALLRYFYSTKSIEVLFGIHSRQRGACSLKLTGRRI
jgi:hypothetical protein